MKACTRSLENRFFWTLSATTPKPVSSTASRASASACGRTAAAIRSTMASICVCESSASTACAALARARERARLGHRRRDHDRWLGWAQSRRPWTGARRARGRPARLSRTVPYCPRADNGGIMPSARTLQAISSHRSDIPHDVPTDNTALVCAGPERAGFGVRPRRGPGPAGGHADGDLRAAARRARQPDPDHLQVPGRRQRAGLRPGLPGVRPFPRRRRRADVDRRPRSVGADEPVEARTGHRVHTHDVHPGGPVHRRRAGAAWACTRRATSAA